MSRESGDGAELLVELHGVGKSFPDAWRRNHRTGGLWRALSGQPDEHAVPVLRDIDLEVRRGESVGLIGENGAGKSTLLKVLTGVLRPSQGKVRTHCRFGALLELGAGFHPEYTGRENIELSGALMGLSATEIARVTPEILAFADIGDQIDEPIKHYSSGMVVRLGFAVLSVTRPELLITDEVLAVGDESFQRKCLRWIDNYVADGGTLMIVSHSMDQIRRLCRHAYWLRDGRIEAAGPAGEIVDRYLEYHDRKNSPDASTEFSAGLYRIVSMRLNDGEDSGIVLEPGTDLRIGFELHSPDDRPPVVAVGIRDRHATAVYGTTSEIDAAVCRRVAPNRYAVEICFPAPPLDSGTYRVSGHAMDPEGLRLFDTVIREFEIPGEQRQEGFIPGAPGAEDAA
ncbi:MAG: ABC transporter ATP-binding protein [Pseudomonadota bacterium]